MRDWVSFERENKKKLLVYGLLQRLYCIRIFKYFSQQHILLRIIYLILTTTMFVAKNWVTWGNYKKGWEIYFFFFWQRLFSNNNGFCNNLYFSQRKKFSRC